MIEKLNTKKLKKKFKKQISNYQKWCKIKGYCSKEKMTLLWYFHRKNKVVCWPIARYYIDYNKKLYDPADIIELFAINNNKVKSKTKAKQ